MNINQLKRSRYLTKQDVGKGILATIAGVQEQDVSGPGEPVDIRWIMTFEEPTLKPLVLNSANGKLLVQIFGSEESDNWMGGKIVLYEDPSIEFKGKRVGGIRIRPPRLKTSPPDNTMQLPQPPDDGPETNENELEIF